MQAPRSVTWPLALVLGGVIAWADLYVDGGELSPGALLLLLFAAAALLAWLRGRPCVIAALLVWMPMPASLLILHAKGHKTTLHPDTVGSILGVAAVALVAVALGSWLGAMGARAARART
jgi:predicted tellurium resistance membrane protein TerC